MAIPNLPSAAQFAQDFRTTYSQVPKAFLISKQDLLDLLAQNSGNTSGVRVYCGLDTSSNTFIGVAVATTGTKNDDFDIPLNRNDPTTAQLKEARPCPVFCGKSDALNQ
jgi:hypothetical protein